MMSTQYEEIPDKNYAFCPPMPVHPPINGPLNCNYPYDVNKETDNYLFPVIVSDHRNIEHFSGGCFAFLFKLFLFVIIMWLIIYLLMK